MERRRKYYAGQPKCVPSNPEESGQVKEQKCIYIPKETISLSLEYSVTGVPYRQKIKHQEQEQDNEQVI